MLETGAHALGCTVFPGGTGQTEQQVQAMADLRARRLRRHAVVPADHPRARPTSIGVKLPQPDARRLVSAEPFPPSLRDALIARGIHGYQVYATRGRRRDRVRDRRRAKGSSSTKGVLVEIVRPGTGDPVAPGEVGEVVATPLVNADYPLIRFGTGDLSALLPVRVAVRAHQPADQGLARAAPTRRRR